MTNYEMIKRIESLERSMTKALTQFLRNQERIDQLETALREIVGHRYQAPVFQELKNIARKALGS